MEREYTDYQYAKYRMLEPPIWGDHYRKALEKFQKSAEEGEPRGTFMLGKILLLWSKNEADAAIEKLEKTLDGKTNPKRKKFFDTIKDFFD